MRKWKYSWIGSIFKKKLHLAAYHLRVHHSQTYPGDTGHRLSWCQSRIDDPTAPAGVLYPSELQFPSMYDRKMVLIMECHKGTFRTVQKRGQYTWTMIIATTCSVVQRILRLLSEIRPIVSETWRLLPTGHWFVWLNHSPKWTTSTTSF